MFAPDNLFLSPFDSVWGGASDECIEVSSRISHGTDEPDSEALRLLVLCVVAVICEIGQPGGWRTPTTAPCARRAGALSRHKDGPRPLLPTSTLAREARRGPKNRDATTKVWRSSRLRQASRGGRSPTPSPRVDRRRARVSLCKCLCHSYLPRRRASFRGVVLPSGRRPYFVGRFRGARARGRAGFSARDRVLLWAWKAGDGWFDLVGASSKLNSSFFMLVCLTGR